MVFETSWKRAPKRLKNKTIKNIIIDLRALYNWAMEDEVRLANKNPVTKEKFALIGSTKFVKPPLNPQDFDRASQAIKNKRDRAWFDVTRFTGMCKDEANRLQWSDVNWDLARIRIPGTKTPESEVWLPLALRRSKRFAFFMRARTETPIPNMYFLAVASRPGERRSTRAAECSSGSGAQRRLKNS